MQPEVVLSPDLITPVYQYEGDANVWSDWRKTMTLLKHLTLRNLAARYRGSVLGFFWSLLNPALLMGVYTFVFRFIFQTTSLGVPYPVFFLTGILAWGFVSAAAINSAVSLVDSASLVRKSAFPRLALPVSVVLSHAVNYVLTLPLLIIFNMIFGVTPTLSLFLLPVALLLLMLTALGIGSFLAALMPFFRDLQHLIEVLFTMWFFMTPVLYPMAMVTENLPKEMLSLYKLNPMVGIMHLVHAVFLGQPLQGMGVGVTVGGVLCLLGLGLWVFHRLAHHSTET